MGKFYRFALLDILYFLYVKAPLQFPQIQSIYVEAVDTLIVLRANYIKVVFYLLHLWRVICVSV